MSSTCCVPYFTDWQGGYQFNIVCATSHRTLETILSAYLFSFFLRLSIFQAFEGKYMTNFHISIVLRNYSFSLLSSMGLGKSKSEEIRDKRNFPINIFIHSSEPLVYRYLFFMTRQSGYIIISTSAFSTIVMVMRFGNLDFPIG
eukprot:TRINITY_DN2027_c0_g2_i6.p1 TRINITY_DN2027_c0_g2~~TRINITY_DN2027_c0_g2_i6.p1  ORF type:complete len:144 (+),score=2.00 TRINITY_DN2027_c0_g2_i6:155-586(+)